MPPNATGPEQEFADRIALSMTYDLNVQLQQAHLPLNLQPSFEPCPDAKPRAPRFGSVIAKALFADAFIGGDVSHSAKYKVSSYVSDAFGRLGTYVVAVNESVDLDDPMIAKMSPSTHAAVLASVAASLVEKGDYISATTVLKVAKNISGDSPPYISQLEEICRKSLPNSGLLSGTP